MACARKPQREAAEVGALARKLGVAHRIVRWTGAKPKTGIQKRRAAGALRAAGRSRARGRRAHIAHRAYARRSGRDRPDAPAARQRPAGLAGMARRSRARRRSPGAAVAGHPESAAGRHAARRRDRLTRRTLPTPIRVSPGARLRALMPALAARGARRPNGSRSWRGGCAAPRLRSTPRRRMMAAHAGRDAGRRARSRSPAASFAATAGRNRTAGARPRRGDARRPKARSSSASWKRCSPAALPAAQRAADSADSGALWPARWSPSQPVNQRRGRAAGGKAPPPVRLTKRRHRAAADGQIALK